MSRWRGDLWVVLLTLSLGFFMTLLDIAVVDGAIPSMIDKLHASLDEILWVINVYILALAALLITSGRLGDVRGPHTMFVGGVRTVRPVAGSGPAHHRPRRARTGRRGAGAADDDDHHRHVPGRTSISWTVAAPTSG